MRDSIIREKALREHALINSADNRHLFQAGLMIKVGLGTNIVLATPFNNGQTAVQVVPSVDFSSVPALSRR